EPFNVPSYWSPLENLAAARNLSNSDNPPKSCRSVSRFSRKRPSRPCRSGYFDIPPPLRDNHQLTLLMNFRPERDNNGRTSWLLAWSDSRSLAERFPA